MIKLAAISPRTNAFLESSQGGGPEVAEFESLFSDMAYSLLETKLPELMNHVVTFKILESNMDENSALGSFILDVNGADVHIPLVLSQGSVQKPEVFYSKELDSFLPLTQKWVESTSALTNAPMGSAENAPKTLPSDMDVRALTLPPTTGRFVYASAGGPFSKERMAVPRISLGEVLERVPNRTKVAFAELLKSDEALLKYAYSIHGTKLLGWLRPKVEKVAAAPRAEWCVLSSDMDSQLFDEFFGPRKSAAYNAAATEGVATFDNRKEAAIPVQLPVGPTEETQNGIFEPQESGVYKVICTTGEVKKALVICNPESVCRGLAYEGFASPYGHRHKYKEHLVLFPNGDFCRPRKLVVVGTTEDLDESKLSKAFHGSNAPSNGRIVMLCSEEGIKGTQPFYVRSLTKKKDGTTSGTFVIHDDKYSKAKDFVLMDKMSTKKVVTPAGTNLTLIPSCYSALKLGKEMEPEGLITDASTLLKMIEAKMVKLSSFETDIKNVGGGEWAVNGKVAGDLAATVTLLAEGGYHATKIAEVVREIPVYQRQRVYAFPKNELSKLASIFGPDPLPPEPPPMDPAMMEGQPPMDPAMQGGQPPMDPAMMGQDPAMMGQDPAMMGQQGMDPSMMQGAAGLQDPSAFDTSAVATLLSSEALSDLVSDYMPDLEKSLDSLARILISIQVRKSQLLQEVGNEEYINLEANVRRVLDGMGELVLSLGRTP
jgi:hypothetical protein